MHKYCIIKIKYCIEYAGKRDNNIGSYCWLIFHVINCHEGCKICNIVVEDINMKCLDKMKMKKLIVILIK